MYMNARRISFPVFLVFLALLAVIPDLAIAASGGQADKKDGADQLLTFSGQIFVLLAALLGAGGGLRYFIEPVLNRRHLRKVMATGLLLSCSELRRHLDEIKTTLSKLDSTAHEMRDALLKLPRYDYNGRPDWFVKWAIFP